MRIIQSIPVLGLAWAVAGAMGQGALPGKPEENGLNPASATVYINTADTINNTSTESLGVAIASNGNVVVGWEDDGSDLTDLEAVWTLFDPAGVSITPNTRITTQDPDFAGQELTSKFLSFFRADKSAISGRTGWGPKIKANPFGAGFGMGATSFDLAKEVTELSAYSGDLGDFPAVQMLDNAGVPLGITLGVPEAYHALEGGIRIADWDYLSNGNIVIVGESRQIADLVDMYAGESAQNHAIVRIVSPSGAEVKAVQLAGATATKTEMWHGAAVTRDGFAVRFSDNGPGVIRLFANDGTPTSTNLDLAVLTGQPIANAGGRGDGVGFHGNGVDAYASVAAGVDTEGVRRVWVTVINTNGTVRWSKSAFDDLELLNTGRCDVAIDSQGRVLVVADDTAGTGGNNRIIIGRLFDAQGQPAGNTFYVSERELPEVATLESRNPRAGLRDNKAAIVWESQTPEPGVRVAALRVFALSTTAGYSIGLNFGADEASGNNAGTVASTNRAGVPAVAQANWNNLTLLSGTNMTLVADANGTSEPTGMSVTWNSANTWSSTGRGEENNTFTGADMALMTGYLDTGGATTTSVKIASIPARLVDAGYDLYLYALGGVPGRGGSYRLLDGNTGKVLRDFIRAQSSSNNTAYVEVPTNLGATANGAANLEFGSGNYLVFRGLTASSITVEAMTAAAGGGVGFSATPRAPINAIQLVSPSSGPLLDDVTVPGDIVAPTSPTSRSPDAEQPPNAIDNNLLTKFLDFNDGDGDAPFVGPVGLTLRTSGGASVVTALALTSANDAPERDPASYRLEGSNDGTTFALVSEGTVPAFAKRFLRQVISFTNTATNTVYRLTIPTVANPATANSMQVAEVELLGTVVAPKITALTRNSDGSLTLEWQGGGTLQAAPTVTGPWVAVPGATSPYKLNTTEAAQFGRIAK